MKVSREHIYEFGELRLDCIEDKPQGAIIHFTGSKNVHKLSLEINHEHVLILVAGLNKYIEQAVDPDEEPKCFDC